MKKAFFAMVGLFLLLSCNETKDSSTENNDAWNKKYRENHQIVLTAIETGDVSKLDSLMTKDCVDHGGNVDGSDIVGIDDTKKFLGSLHTWIDGLKCELKESATSPDGVYFYATVRITGKAGKNNPFGMPPGMDMDDTSVDLVKIKDGKATDHWGFWSNKDVAEMQKAMMPSDKGGNPPPVKDSMR